MPIEFARSERSTVGIEWEIAIVDRASGLITARPRTLLALKAAVAAGLAWLVVLPFSGVADDYPYYAPLGAVVATSTSGI